MKLTTIFSTGDAGAARGALEAADELKLKVGGWTAVNGLPAICTERLKPTLAPRMAARLNVQDSDGTLIVSFSTSLPAGSPAAYADEAAAQQRKASLHLVLPDRGRTTIPEDVRKGVVAWIAEERIATLHVTGPREAEEPGIQQAVHDALVWIFEDEVQPRATFAGVDRSAVPESLRTPEAEIERLAAEMTAMPSPTHIAINPANVDAAIAAGLVVTADVACTDCVRLCFDGVRSKPGGLSRAGVVHATPLDGPDVPLCEIEQCIVCCQVGHRAGDHCTMCGGGPGCAHQTGAAEL